MSGTLLLSSGPQRNIIRRKPPPVYFPSPPPRTSSLRTPIAFRSVPRMNLHKRLPELPFDIGLDTTRDCGEDSDATLVNERHRPSRLGHRARTSIVRSSTIATPETLKTVDQSQISPSNPPPDRRRRRPNVNHPSRIHRSSTLPTHPPAQSELGASQTSPMRQIKQCPPPYETELDMQVPAEKATTPASNGTSHHVIYPELPLHGSWHVEQPNSRAVPVVLNTTSDLFTSGSVDRFQIIGVISGASKEDDNVGRKAPASRSSRQAVRLSASKAWRKLKKLGTAIRRGFARMLKSPTIAVSTKY